MEGWIFKRTALRFLSWMGAILLLLFGCGACFSGMVGQSTILVIVGVILFFGGIFLVMFSKSLNKWIEIKK
jgi:lipoprotein signal peptidase